MIRERRLVDGDQGCCPALAATPANRQPQLLPGATRLPVGEAAEDVTVDVRQAVEAAEERAPCSPGRPAELRLEEPRVVDGLQGCSPGSPLMACFRAETPRLAVFDWRLAVLGTQCAHRQWELGAVLCAVAAFVLPGAAGAQATSGCSTTLECAQQMASALADLRKTDAELAARIQAAFNDLANAAKASAEADAALQKTLTAQFDAKLAALARGEDVHPRGGPHTGPICPKGQVMVGAKYEVASGRNAGALYNGIWPICRPVR
jgi:hypothetical protein